MSRLLAIADKELRQVRRDPLTLAMMVVMPVMQLLLFGYAINNDVRHMPTVVLDHDHSSRSRDFVRSMEVTGYYDIVGHVRSYEEVERAFRAGRAKVAVVFPDGYGAAVAARRGGTVQVIVDGSDPQTVASATSTAASLAADTSARLSVVRAAPLVATEPTVWYNPELRTAVFVVPGIIGVILTMTMVMLTSMAIARERERGTLEALIVSPVRGYELMIGKLLPYVAVGYVQVTLILAAGHVVFEVPFRGSLPLLYALSFVFIAANLALGLVFSTLAATQQQAMQMSFFFLLPNILLSGFAFPWEGMPRPAQLLSEVLPLTHYLRIVRGITLKGAEFDDVSGELFWMSVILVGFVTLASVRFRKKLV
ncbi:MAG: ABC transporter permease [Sandaracinaceae bacterium]|jgi:ABC-2 type transport system permease protein|nr:ABC transporter permease [Sandaracinaceae bacterium]MBP7681110.1 ABC transporter permease [Deltaproteobacteria bacterium]MBK7155583.1 ABC transporter permease [Sandaracinaceae bacterium]MBK7776991.1 ABC transporter permease [Sandaracinaceae bacterium]MBK8409541.1 ABC transporter permease [Sandaracinaceae bacterium]